MGQKRRGENLMTKKYHHIRAWGKLLGSYEYYIKDQQGWAAFENAPQNAIYRGDDKWVTVDDLTNKQLRDIVNSRAIRLEEKEVDDE